MELYHLTAKLLDCFGEPESSHNYAKYEGIAKWLNQPRLGLKKKKAIYSAIINFIMTNEHILFIIHQQCGQNLQALNL